MNLENKNLEDDTVAELSNYEIRKLKDINKNKSKNIDLNKVYAYSNQQTNPYANEVCGNCKWFEYNDCQMFAKTTKINLLTPACTEFISDGTL